MKPFSEYEFNAEDLCRAWLSVATAAAEDVDRPLLYRAVAIEVWPAGIRLIATDSMMLWTAFVPSFGLHVTDAPLFEELPDRVIVACDEDFRARDLLKFAFKTVTAIRAVDGIYPEWRSLLSVAPKSAKELMLNPELLHRVVSVKRYYGEPLQLRLSGSAGAILLEPRESSYPKPQLLGAVMPLRKSECERPS